MTAVALDHPIHPEPVARHDDGQDMRVAMAIVGALGLIGLAGSFENVAAYAAERGVSRPWLLPLGIDGAIAGFTWFELKLAHHNKRATWIGLFVWALTAVTVVLNVAGEPDLWGITAHAALPLLWKASVAAYKTWKKSTAAATDRIPAARWVCAPWPTARLWRRMRVWGITSYAEALELERRRVLARLTDRYGSLAEAPARKRELYRLIAAAAGIDVDETPEPAPLVEPVVAAPAPATHVPPAPRRRAPVRKKTGVRPAKATDDELADAAVALERTKPGTVLTSWQACATALRADGWKFGNTRIQDTVLDLARTRIKETEIDA